MKKIQKFTIIGAMALFVPLLAFAQTDATVDLQAEIDALQATKAEIHTQVEAGTLTKEEAKVMWTEKIDKVRSLKDEVFTTRMLKIQEKFAARAAEHPENAAEISQKLNEITAMAQTQRTESKAFSKEVRAKVKSGEMTKEEAKAQVSEMRKTMKTQREESREMRKTAIEEKKAERVAEREQKKAEKEVEQAVREENREMKKVETEEQKVERVTEREEKKGEKEVMEEEVQEMKTIQQRDGAKPNEKRK